MGQVGTDPEHNARGCRGNQHISVTQAIGHVSWTWSESRSLAVQENIEKSDVQQAEGWRVPLDPLTAGLVLARLHLKFEETGHMRCGTQPGCSFAHVRIQVVGLANPPPTQLPGLGISTFEIMQTRKALAGNKETPGSAPTSQHKSSAVRVLSQTQHNRS